jgi:anti-sigma B factor antagonist
VKLVEHVRGRFAIIDVHGPMIRDEAEPLVLLTALRASVERGCSHILLNVAEVSSVDSLWLGALVQGYTTAARQGGTIKLLHVSKRFQELLAVTKLNRVLEAFESEDEAMAGT